MLLGLASCNGTNEYPENSILGAWRCYEETRTNTPYDITIDSDRDDSTRVSIYNLSNLGQDIITYATYTDTLITIIFTESSLGHDFIGAGHVKRDYSEIFWQYNHFGPSGSSRVEVRCVRK